MRSDGFHQRVLQEFDSCFELPIQWGDQDPNGHVNHAAPVRWLESARIDYIRSNGVAEALREAGLSPLVAGIELRYRRQLIFPDHAVIGTRVDTMRKTQLTLRQAIFSLDAQALAIEATIQVVMFDPKAQRPRRVPPQVVELFAGRDNDNDNDNDAS